MMMIFSSLKTWYVQDETLDLCTNATSNVLSQKTFTADAVMQALRENRIPLLIENGGTCPVPFQGKREVLNPSSDSRSAAGSAESRAGHPSSDE
jgi:hypothetical protein